GRVSASSTAPATRCTPARRCRPPGHHFGQLPVQSQNAVNLRDKSVGDGEGRLFLTELRFCNPLLSRNRRSIWFVGFNLWIRSLVSASGFDLWFQLLVSISGFNLSSQLTQRTAAAA